jgi:hypothetical protein
MFPKPGTTAPERRAGALSGGEARSTAEAILGLSFSMMAEVDMAYRVVGAAEQCPFSGISAVADLRKKLTR